MTQQSHMASKKFRKLTTLTLKGKKKKRMFLFCFLQEGKEGNRLRNGSKRQKISF